MINPETDGSPSHVEPILAVKDIIETVSYWHDILGFTNTWTWGDPPDHGGVSWNGVSIQFHNNPELAATSKGNAIFINVKKLEALYDFHQKKNAEIVERLENKPWGNASYTVKDSNGYYIVFGGPRIVEEKKHSTTLPPTVKIIARLPTIKQYQQLATAVGWTAYNTDERTEKILGVSLFAVIAEVEQSNEVIGCALVTGDDASFYYIKDVMVHPNWQSKHIGTALLRELTQWIQKNGADNALVGLITGEHLAPFYKQFGFAPAFSMVHYIKR